MEKIKAFIEYAAEMEQQIADAFQSRKKLYLFNSEPHFMYLQLEMEKRAKEVGVLSIYKEDDYLNVQLKSKTFEAIAFSNVEKRQTTDAGGVTWNHFRVVEDGVVYEACKQVEIKNASA